MLQYRDLYSAARSTVSYSTLSTDVGTVPVVPVPAPGYGGATVALSYCIICTSLLDPHPPGRCAHVACTVPLLTTVPTGGACELSPRIRARASLRDSAMSLRVQSKRVRQADTEPSCSPPSWPAGPCRSGMLDVNTRLNSHRFCAAATLMLVVALALAAKAHGGVAASRPAQRLVPDVGEEECGADLHVPPGVAFRFVNVHCAADGRRESLSGRHLCGGRFPTRGAALTRRSARSRP